MNSVNLIGRLTRDPELRINQNDVSTALFTLAVENRGKNNGTSFIPIICFNNQADNVVKCLKKGALVGVSGRLMQRSYENKEGVKISVFEVIADSVKFLEPKQEQKTDNQEQQEKTIYDEVDEELPF